MKVSCTPPDREAVVRIHNTNTRKLIIARFALEDGKAAVEGDFVLPGVAGSGAPIKLEFLAPGGAATGHLLPTGNVVDLLALDGADPIEASMVDAANPCVFVAAEALDLTGIEMPDQLERDTALMQRLEAIRLAASLRMGIATTPAEAARKPSIPKIAIVNWPSRRRDAHRRPSCRWRLRRYYPHDLDRPAASRRAAHWRDVSRGRGPPPRHHRRARRSCSCHAQRAAPYRPAVRLDGRRLGAPA